MNTYKTLGQQFALITSALLISSLPYIANAQLDENMTVATNKEKEVDVLVPDYSPEQKKQNLMDKLAEIHHMTSEFTQLIVNEAGETLQEGKGTLTISKPNLVNWHTTEPDETLIVSDGANLWFYDPFIEQATVYSFNQSIANTPVLLLTSEDESLWDNYRVSQHTPNAYLIHSLDANNQVKSMELFFKNQQLHKLIIEDSTGQFNQITLIELDTITIPDSALFTFKPSEDVNIDDQR